MRRVGLVLCGCTAFAGTAAAARAQEVLITPQARVEVVGLKRWSVPMIQDSLARYAPQDSLTSHACAAVLRLKLGFPDAAATYFGPDASGLERIVVAVVEPQDSALVRYRPLAPDSLPDIAEYAAAVAVFRSHNHELQALIQDSTFLVARAAAAPADARRQLLEPVRQMVMKERTARGQRRASMVLARDRNPYNRVMALLVLSGFAAEEATWWTLADELRYPNAMVGATASQLLTTLARYAPRTVDWTPALDGLQAIMAGTNLFSHVQLLEVLTRTRVAPRLARPLLQAGAPLLLARLRASREAGHDVTRAFLEQVSGEHFGDDLDAWTRWVTSELRDQK